MRPRIPIIQTIVLLLAIPLVYRLQYYFNIIPFIRSVIPDSIANISDHEHYVAGWVPLIILHWISLVVTLVFLRANRLDLSAIGYNNDLKKSMIVLTSLFLVGLLFYFLKANTTLSLETISNGLFSPTLSTSGELISWIFISINAAFCEEIVYRGFGITSLKSLGLNRFLYLVLPIVSWILIHDLMAYGGLTQGTLFLGLNGILFSALYLWHKDLNLPIGVHAIANLFIILF